MSGQGSFQGKTSDVDKRHGDPSMGGLTSGEKAALSRGQTPKSVKEDATGEKKQAAEAYLKQKKQEKGHHDKGHK